MQSEGMKQKWTEWWRRMSGMNRAVVPLIPREETKRGHKNLHPGSLCSFSPSLPTCIPSALLSWDISPQNILIQKGDIHTRSSTLRTARLGDCALCKTGNSLFSFQKVYPRGAHILAVGKEKQRGLWVTQPCFFLERTLGQHNWMIHFKEAPWEDHGGKTGKC